MHLSIVGERGGRFWSLVQGEADLFDSSKKIFAGKLRRYHGESWLARLTDVKTIILNIRDILLLIVGFFESFIYLVLHRPDVIFIKGGFVGVPIGLVAMILRIPYITHDSDAVAGLTNRLIGRGAKLHAVGMPAKFYNYPKDKIVFVGVPIGEDFREVSTRQKLSALSKLGIKKNNKLLLVTGGSNGAQRLDVMVKNVADRLLAKYSDLVIIHQVGRGNESIYAGTEAEKTKRVIVHKFLDPMSLYSAGADVIIARGGATTIAEFAGQAKACIIVPNPYLTGGHQLYNAKVLEESNSIKVVQEEASAEEFLGAVGELLDNDSLRLELGRALHELIPANATQKIGDLLLMEGGETTR